MHLQLLDRIESFCCISFVENSVQTAITDRIQHQTMLITKNLLFLLVGEPSRCPLVGVRGGAFAYTPSPYKDLSLRQQFVFARYALPGINSATLFYVGIRANHHAIPFIKANLEPVVG